MAGLFSQAWSKELPTLVKYTTYLITRFREKKKKTSTVDNLYANEGNKK